ncbi:hypothetical protein TorRG33x02_021130, partial [Trema orientale]
GTGAAAETGKTAAETGTSAETGATTVTTSLEETTGVEPTGFCTKEDEPEADKAVKPPHQTRRPQNPNPMGSKQSQPPSTPTPTAAPTPLHQSDADDVDDNVKQLNECSSLYLALQVLPFSSLKPKILNFVIS